jgi:hypothetical protein
MDDPLLYYISMTEDDCFMKQTGSGRPVLAQNVFLPVEMALKVGQGSVFDGLVKFPDLVLGFQILKLVS